MAKKATKKAVKKTKPVAKKTVKKAVKTVVKKTTKKASPKSVPVKTVKKSNKPKAKTTNKKPEATPIKSLAITPMVTFNGNCEEAFNFYKSVFGGEFSYLGRFKEMPASKETGGQSISGKNGERIMHVSLPISKETSLLGSDILDGWGDSTVFGNNFTISINAPGKKEADRLYTELSAGGKASMPMSNTFWGSYFGMLTDKFNVQWMISF